MSQPTILAFDSSCPTASIAVQVGERCVECELVSGTHARLLVPMIEATLVEAGLSMGNIDTIVTTVGPGSFTGIRISLSAAHGFMLARLHTLKTCSSLEAVAHEFFMEHPAEGLCDVWLNAGKQEAYTQSFTRTDTLPKAANEISLKPLYAVASVHMPTVGNIEHVKHHIDAPSARVLCSMAAHLPSTTIDKAMPLYVRAPDAKPPAPFEWLASKA